MTAQNNRVVIILAFLSIYIIWGSTYLGIRFAIESMPPLVMSGARYLSAGLVLYIIMRLRGIARPTPRQWVSGFIIGALLLLIGNGAVASAEKTVPSGIAALVVATVPLWFAVINWIVFKAERPGLRVSFGLILGFCGIVALIGPGITSAGSGIPASGLLLIVMATIGWAFGSLYSRKAPLPADPFMVTAIQMLCGGFLLLLAGTVTGEWKNFDIASVTEKSFLGWLYLTIFGSLVAFTAYSWLVRTVRPGLVSTYAYVNPVIAVLLGWALGGEKLTGSSLVGAIVIITSVVIISTARKSA